MKAESNILPKKLFDIENITNGKCDVVFYDNIEILEPTEEGENRYSFDIYRLKTNYRDNLAEELDKDKTKFNSWLELAKNTEIRQNANEEIASLQEELNNTDYKIIKCSEYQLAGLEIPYDIAELHNKRQVLRDRINELQEL